MNDGAGTTERERRLPAGSFLVLAGASLVGLASFLYPFILPMTISQATNQDGNAAVAPYVFAAVGAMSVLALLVTVTPRQGSSRSREVALLGVLVAIDAVLRLVPSVLGATPIFLLIVLTGVAFGPLFGFQMGTLSLLFSAFVTGGVGPWLPFQMLAAGWIGMSAGWLPHRGPHWLRLAVIALFAAVWGFLFGALMNLWFWPFSAPGGGVDASLYWSPELGGIETLQRYSRFYLVTSFGFDAARAIGNVVLVAVFASPILRLLERYRDRFTWEPWTEFEHPVPAPESAS